MPITLYNGLFSCGNFYLRSLKLRERIEHQGCTFILGHKPKFVEKTKSLFFGSHITLIYFWIISNPRNCLLNPKCSREYFCNQYSLRLEFQKQFWYISSVYFKNFQWPWRKRVEFTWTTELQYVDSVPTPCSSLCRNRAVNDHQC